MSFVLSFFFGRFFWWESGERLGWALDFGWGFFEGRIFIPHTCTQLFSFTGVLGEGWGGKAVSLLYSTLIR